MDSKSSAAPEVVPMHHGENAPEVVPEGGLETGHYTDLPEAVVEHTADAKYDSHAIPPAYSESRAFIPTEQAQVPQRKRRRWTLWAIIGVVVLLVIIGAVVGGVVGSRKSSSSSSDSSSSSSSSTSSAPSSSSTAHAPFSASSNTALAMTVGEPNTKQYAYQQLANGSVVEIPYTQSGGWDYGSATIAISKLGSGMPLAATTYNTNGITYRLLVFPDANGGLNVVNTTDQGGWTTPLNVISGKEKVDLNSSTVAVCADPSRRIRMYFGSAKTGWLQEVGYELTGSVHQFDIDTAWANVDLTTGFACTMSNDLGRLYFNYKGVNTPNQMYYDFTTTTNPRWINGSLPVAPYSALSSASSMAATTDGSNTDYVFWTLQNGTTVRATYNSYQSISSYTTFSDVPAKSKLAAIYQGSGTGQNTILQYRPSGSANVSYIVTNSSGSVQSSGGVD
ncbi:hypothetical protein AMS68_001409 [Peltaster fructicola]|uniref:Fucose-specific lectin n=1 Tax=Peltaster fructicola TaxID=286661 RepID=A0A6H0XMB0_9PEZI|nr:hypothetical protein AMS68_001409 [Peltaster fructicola]